MKLYLMRHAKSDWETSQSDHERPLNARGKSAAKFMGKFMSEAGELPQRIIASSAKRAQETAELFMKSASFSGEFQTEETLYETGTDEYLKVIEKHMSSGIESLLLIAHNPTLELLVSGLTARSSLNIRFPTAAIAGIELHTPAVGELYFFFLPRILMKSKL